jgi:hypothetical protein
MIAIVNSIVAGAGASLVAHRFMAQRPFVVWAIGAAVAGASLVGLFAFQYWCFRDTEPDREPEPNGEGSDVGPSPR